MGCAAFEFYLGLFLMVVKFWLYTLDVPDYLCKVQISWKSDERCRAVLCGPVMVMSVCAPDSGKDLEEHEMFIRGVTKILHEERRGAK